MRLRVLGVVALLFAAPAVCAAAEPVRVLAAFTLKPALDAIAQAYRATGGAVMPVYGPSPGLAKQIENGAPGDLFFSADPMWTDELTRHRLVRPGTLADLVGNHLVLIARKGTPPLDLKALPQAVGAGPIAMCDPDSHPAGRMAKASLITLGLWDGIEKKVARAESPLLAVKMVARGDVPYAVVFTTDAITDPGVEIAATFPDSSHPPIRYPAVILAGSTNPNAEKFLDYLKSPAATGIFKRYGYVTVGSK